MITHDRWQRIKEIFQSAQEKTPTERLDFLNEVCADDKSIREEVEALLTADESNAGDDFLSAPAYQFVEGMLLDEKPAPSEFEPDQKIGRYTILCQLGAGGMGQIYLAQDEQLGRKIALKLIAPEFATDERRVRRFEQEARAASALNHPNVCVIHETGVTENNRHFIAMEYIQGSTLRDKLRLEPLAPLEAVHIARQIADALAAAHAARIVHRDIKPENIMLRPDGYVKVLDFGLAKLTELLPEPPLDDQHPRHLSTTVRTEAGTLMGTVKYMSPEQLRESDLDERTDIWSLGVVLYEMLTGTTPFEARSQKETIGLILGPQAPALSDQIPARFRKILAKALEKDRAFRYQTITKLAADLNALQRQLERESEHALTPHRVPALLPWQSSPSTQTTRTLTSGSAIFMRLKSQAIHTADLLFTEMRSHKTVTLFAGMTVVLALIFFIPPLVRQFLNPASQGTQIQMKPLTNSGTSVAAAIAPDGKMVAHVEEQDGKQRLMLTSTTTYGATEVVVAPDTVNFIGLTFSPDNLYLYFTRKDKDGARNLYRLSTHGGTPAKVKERVDSPVSFTPAGTHFAFVRFDENESEYRLIVCDVLGANETVIAARKDGSTFSTSGLAWSPDGNIIVCPAGRWDQGFRTDLLAFDVQSKSPRLLSRQSWFSVHQIAWKEDMSGVVISAKVREATPHQLWRITYPAGEVQNITSDLNEYMGASVVGDNIVTVRQDRSWQLWVGDIHDFDKAKSIVSGVGFTHGVTWIASGNIVYSSMIRDRLNISRIAADGSNKLQLTELGDNYNPVASADGRWIVFSSKRNGHFNIWRMNSDDGGDLKQLTYTDGNFYPAVSPDNQWVGYDNIRSLRGSVWKVPFEGGTPVKVADGYRMPSFSPDNRWVAVRYDDIVPAAGDLAIYPLGGGEATRKIEIPRLDWQRVYWLDDHTVSYLKTANGYSNICSFDLNTFTEKQLTHFNSEQIYSYAWSPDFKRVAVARGRKVSDVTIISSER